MQGVTTNPSVETEVFMLRPNAPLMPEDERCLAMLLVEDGLHDCRTRGSLHECHQLLPRNSWHAGGPGTRGRTGLRAHTGRPTPAITPAGALDCGVAVHSVVGPRRIFYHLGIPRSKVGWVLARYQRPRLV